MRLNSKTSPSQEWQSLQNAKIRLPLSYGLFRPTNVSICTNPKRNGGKYSWSVQPVVWQSSHNLLVDVDLSSVHLEVENQGTSREVVCTAGQWNHLLPLFLLLLEIKKIACTEKDDVITQEQEGLWISILHNPYSRVVSELGEKQGLRHFPFLGISYVAVVNTIRAFFPVHGI